MGSTKPCPACKGTGTYGVGGPGAWTSSTCSKCKGTKVVPA